MIIDGHVRLGAGREVRLTADELIATMDALGIDACLAAPDEAGTAVANAEANQRVLAAARAYPGRVYAYAVANPWFGAAALDTLRAARDGGAVALAVDPVLQGFDLLDGLLDPLLELVGAWGWPVYVRTGTPPTALPLPLAELARRHPRTAFIMGRSGATDFWIDAVPALRRADNLYADTAYAPWDTVLTDMAADELIGARRIMFCSDAPYAISSVELARMWDWPLSATARGEVLGGTAARLLGRELGLGLG